MNLVGDPFDPRQEPGPLAPRIAIVEAIDIGQQHHGIGPGCLGNARGEAVVVAEANLGGGD